MSDEASAAPTRSGFVALIGAPNAGKSTLLNRLVGAKVSIVTHKVQTTRAIVRGIATHDNAQIVFVDTPGIFRPKRRLDRAMVTTAWGGARDADIVVVLIDAERGIKGDAEALLDSLADIRQPRVLLLNKIDRVKREALLKLFSEYDLIAAPGRATVAFPIGVDFTEAYKDVRPGPSVIASMNLLGAPAACMPNGFGENDLPTSIQFNAAPSNETLLLNAAIHYQLSTYHHVKKPAGFA